MLPRTLCFRKAGKLPQKFNMGVIFQEDFQWHLLYITVNRPGVRPLIMIYLFPSLAVIFSSSWPKSITRSYTFVLSCPRLISWPKASLHLKDLNKICLVYKVDQSSKIIIGSTLKNIYTIAKFLPNRFFGV